MNQNTNTTRRGQGARSTLCRVLFFVSGIFVACSSEGPTSDASTDGNKKPDVSYGDTSVDVDIDASCGPVDVSSFQPTTMKPPNAPHANKCTTQQVSDYAQCQGAKQTSLCQQFADGQSGQTCRMCIETQTTDAKWGVIVFEGSGNGVFNIEGCVDDALAEVSLEPKSCGQLLYASYGCQQAACGLCAGDALDTCVTNTLTGGCSSYDLLVESDSGPCSPLLGDAAPASAASCFPDPSITNVAAQRADFLTRMAKYMCGS